MKIYKNTLIQRGFTLIELLVSMIITIIIIGLLVFVTRSAFDTLSQGSGNVSSYQKANIALDQLATDLESLVIRSGNDFDWLVANTAGGDADANGITAFGSNLAFFTVAADRYDGDFIGNAGDVACVHYGLGFVDPIGGGDQKMILYRNVRDPDDVFTNLLGAGNQGDLMTALGAIPQTPDNIVTDNIRELTVSFTVEYSTTDAAGVTTPVVARIPVISSGANNASDFRIQGNGIFAPAAGGAADIESGKVLSIDINAQVISEDTQGLLNLDTVPVEKVQKGITRFSKTIHIAQLN